MTAMLFVILAFCVIVAIIILGVGGFFALLKLGIIVREASRPAHQDFNSYTLDQGREVRPEEEH